MRKHRGILKKSPIGEREGDEDIDQEESANEKNPTEYRANENDRVESDGKFHLTAFFFQIVPTRRSSTSMEPAFAMKTAPQNSSESIYRRVLHWFRCV